MPSSAEVDNIKASLQQSRPVAMHISWNGGGGHLVTIYGWYSSSNTNYYYIADPYDGFVTRTGAPSGGVWDGDMYTTKNS